MQQFIIWILLPRQLNHSRCQNLAQTRADTIHILAIHLGPNLIGWWHVQCRATRAAFAASNAPFQGRRLVEKGGKIHINPDGTPQRYASCCWHNSEEPLGMSSPECGFRIQLLLPLPHPTHILPHILPQSSSLSCLSASKVLLLAGLHHAAGSVWLYGSCAGRGAARTAGPPLNQYSSWYASISGK